MPYVIFKKGINADESKDVHLCDTKEQVVSALFKGNPPEGLKFEDIRHVSGVVVAEVDRFIDHR